MNIILNKVSSFFKFKERSTTFKKEIIGGLSTFVAMAYILAVNPGMLSNSNGGQNYTGVFFLGTALVAFIGTFAMALKANLPIAIAPGMGVNAFFTYTVAGSVLGMQVEEALVATFISGLLYAILALSPLRNKIAQILPRNMKLAIGSMIGLFLAYIGLSDSGIITSGAESAAALPMAAVSTKLGNFGDPFVIVAVVVLLLVFVLHFMKVKGAALIAIISGVVLLAILKGTGVADAGSAFKLQSYNSFGKFGTLSSKMWHSFGSAMSNGKFYIAVFVFLYIDFFDTTGTLFSIAEQAGLKEDESQDKWMKSANLVDAGSTIAGSILLTSTATSYIESSVGVSQGARTGFASVITALCFGLGIAIWPIMSPILPFDHVPVGASVTNGFGYNTIMPVTGPILVLVGALMISQLKFFDWQQTIDIPVLFTTLVFGMLGYSVSTGIAAGVIVYYSINSVAFIVTRFKKDFTIYDETIAMTDKVSGKKTKNPDFRKRIFNPIMIGMFILAITYFATMPLYY